MLMDANLSNIISSAPNALSTLPGVSSELSLTHDGYIVNEPSNTFTAEVAMDENPCLEFLWKPLL